MTVDTISRKDLWEKIDRLDFGGLEDGMFFKQLAKENNWGNHFTRQAIKEYKKFMYLAAVSDVRVVPPKIVDKVWHKHLCFTNHYWNTFCPKILEKNIHHQPSSQTQEAGSQDAGDFRSTVDKYKEEFNASPPAFIWSQRLRNATNLVTFSALTVLGLSWYDNAISDFSFFSTAALITCAYISLMGVFIWGDDAAEIFDYTSCGACSASGGSGFDGGGGGHSCGGGDGGGGD